MAKKEVKEGFKIVECFYCGKNPTEVSNKCVRYQCFECVDKSLEEEMMKQEKKC